METPNKENIKLIYDLLVLFYVTMTSLRKSFTKIINSLFNKFVRPVFVFLKKVSETEPSKYFFELCKRILLYGVPLSVSYLCIVGQLSFLKFLRFSVGFGILFWFFKWELGPWLSRYVTTGK